MNKIKKVFLAVFIVLAALSYNQLSASIAYPGLISFKQPDGTTIRMYLKGDEKVKWAETEDGYSILFNSKGIYEYAVVQDSINMIPSGVVAKNVEERSPDVANLLSKIPKHIKYSKSQAAMARQIWKMTKSINPEKVFPTKGSRKLICILMGFPDKSFSKTQTDFNNLFNQVGYSANFATGSVHDFFAESSYNQLNLNVTVAGPFVAANNMAYYGGNDSNGKDLRPRELIAEAINLADPTVNFADFDNDNDGTVDGVYVIYAGYGEEAGGGADCIWAHAWNLETPVVKDGKIISKYSCSCELAGNSGSITSPIGVICHEFGHVLGAPDFYDTDYDTNGQYAGTGNWDLQAMGSWNNNGITPAQPNAYTKCYIYNWASASVLSGPQTITLNNSTQNAGSFYRLNSTTTNEYFLLENRQKLGFDSYNPGNGLLVYHVDGSFISANSYTVNAGSHQGMYIIPANSSSANGITVSDLVTLNSNGAPFPGSTGKTAFTDATTPSALSWAGTLTSKPITAIVENKATKTVTIDFMGGNVGTAPTVSASGFSTTAIVNNSMTIGWTRGNGNAVLVLARAYNPVNEIPGGATYTANSAFGTGTQLGSGNYVVYNGTGNSVTVTGLASGTNFYYAVFEYNTNPNSFLSSALTGNALTTGTVNLVYVTAGGLSTAISTANQASITTLKLVGTIDARDFKTMRDNMPLLSSLDLSETDITSYSGLNGTGITSLTYNYSTNSLPIYAFYNPNTGVSKTSLKSITMPLSITSINSQAFYGCTGLTGTVTIPNSVGTIYNYAFYNCSGVSSFVLSNTVSKIYDYAFLNCNGLTSISLPASLTYMGLRPFNFCSTLTQINVDANNLAFSSVDGVLFSKDQTKLIQFPGGKSGSYSIPNTVTNIGVNAFYGCNYLSSLTIPNTVNTIESHALGFCNLLTGFTVSSDNPYLSVLDGVLFNKNQTELIQCPSGKTGAYNVPASVVAIRESSFIRCIKLTSVVIPASVTLIGDNTFYYCTGLTSVTIPASITSFGDFAFYYCYKLTSFTIPAATSHLGNYALDLCTGLTSINANSSYPVDLSAVSGVFLNINKTTCVLNVPYNSKTLYAASSQWSDFTNIVANTQGFILGTTAINLTSAAASSQVSITANVAWSASSNQSWLTVTPGSGTGNNTLVLNVEANQTSLTRTAMVTVSSTGLPSQTIVVKQTGIAKTASVTAGNLATTLTTDELNGISDLTLSGTIDARDFKTLRDIMPMLTKVNLSAVTIVAYTGTDGTNGSISNTYAAGEIPAKAFYQKEILTTVVLPTSTTSIATMALGNCYGLTGILNIPGSVTNIGDGGFMYCKNLATVTIPTSVTTIGNYVFDACSANIVVDAANLNFSSQDGVLFNKSKTVLYQCPTNKTGEYSIPSTVTTVAMWAFENCVLSSVKIPQSVTSIDDGAFYHCNSLTSLYAYSKTPVNLSAVSNVFDGISLTNCSLYVPIGSKTAYQAAMKWQDFQNIIEVVTAVQALSETEIKIYPNPISDAFRIQGYNGNVSLRISDLNGRELLSKQVNSQESISVANLPKGIYIVRISSNDFATEKKLVKK